MATIPINLIVCLLFGLTMAAAARTQILSGASPWQRELSLVLSFTLVAVAPTVAYFYWTYSDWSWMYLVDPGHLPTGTGLLVVVLVVLMVPLGFLSGYLLLRLLRQQGTAVLFALLGFLSTGLLLLLVIMRHRLGLLSSYEDFHHLPPAAAARVFREGTRVATLLLIIDLPRPPAPLHLLRLASMLPLASWVPFVHDGLISSLRAYSPSALRALVGAAFLVACSHAGDVGPFVTPDAVSSIASSESGASDVYQSAEFGGRRGFPRSVPVSAAATSQSTWRCSFSMGRIWLSYTRMPLALRMASSPSSR